jgi:ribose 1,5-bisphosphate isomerase
MVAREPLDSIVHRIRSLEIQGAKQIAVESLKWLRPLVKETGFGKDFEHAAKALEGTRPTAVVLHNCLDILRKERNIKAIDRLLDTLSRASKQIGQHGARLIPDGSTVMTHCHSGEALSVIWAAKAAGKKVTVIATETEPKHQGIITVKELAAHGIQTTLITDGAIAFFMPEVDLVLTGSDAMRKDGNINKIGTLTMAIAAKEFNKPYYVAGNTLKLDSRKKFEIEERPASEVYHGLSSLKGISVRNPAFDLTPWRYVKRVVTEKGVLTPGNLMRLLKEK